MKTDPELELRQIIKTAALAACDDLPSTDTVDKGVWQHGEEPVKSLAYVQLDKELADSIEEDTKRRRAMQAYLVACCPSRVLHLLDRVDRAEKLLDEVQQQLMAESAEKTEMLNKVLWEIEAERLMGVVEAPCGVEPVDSVRRVLMELQAARVRK